MRTKLIIVAVFCVILFVVCCRQNKVNQHMPNSIGPIPYLAIGKAGYFDISGKELFQFDIGRTSNEKYLLPEYFKGGLARICKRDTNEAVLFGYMDTTGNVAIECQFDDAGPFSEGLAYVSKGGVCKFINAKGQVVFIADSAVNCSSFHDGLASFRDRKGKIGFLDKNGNIKIKPAFDEVLYFTEGLCAVCNEAYDYDKRWGYIDTTGKMVIGFKFSYPSVFSEGLALVSIDGKYPQYVDRGGEVAIKTSYPEARPFKNGLAAVSEDGELFGYINKHGNYAIWPQFHDAHSFSDCGLACVSITSKNTVPEQLTSILTKDHTKTDKELYGYIDKNGSFYIKPQFPYPADFVGNFALVRKDDPMSPDYYLINSSGDFITKKGYSVFKDKLGEN